MDEVNRIYWLFLCTPAYVLRTQKGPHKWWKEEAHKVGMIGTKWHISGYPSDIWDCQPTEQSLNCLNKIVWTRLWWCYTSAMTRLHKLMHELVSKRNGEGKVVQAVEDPYPFRTTLWAFSYKIFILLEDHYMWDRLLEGFFTFYIW